jgi:ABC-2 type transport system ATP-binding protein
VTAALVSINDVCKGFAGSEARALDGVSAEVRAGHITGLVGPDGAGKTTLLRLIAGLLLPDRGRISVDGFDAVSDSEAVHMRLGYMPQRFGLYEDLSVAENLRLYAELRGLDPAERDDTFARLLRFTGLGPFTTRRAGALSGGMKQKLGLACALITAPRLLLLDEPSVGVDPVSRRELWRMVEALVERDVAVVWSTAYLDEAENCDEVLLLNAGQLLYDGPPAELTARVEGRTVLVKGLQRRRRAVLADALRRDGVIDGVIQGSAVRLVLAAPDRAPTAADLDAGETATVEPVRPRFEDAFIDALGGGPGGDSELAQHMRSFPGDGRPVIEATGLTKRFGDFTAVDDIEFSISPGEIFGLLGPNGAGKSTTFKMLCGLLRPSAGSARVTGLDLQHASSAARNRIGYMAQKFSLYGNLSVAQNLDFFSSVYGLRGGARRRAVARMVEIFDLARYLRTPAEALPLGYKQRLALACAVMHEPPVLFLDEPTSGVDPQTRREFWTHINGMVEKGVTVMVTTHFMDEAEYCDRVAVIYRGRVIAAAPPDEIKASTRSEDLPEPTLEDAFVELIRRSESAGQEAA